ncbi:MAG TPA: c-type cytochrome [Terriglobia bacterium]|nr:c-type cytochrome [Terriglobia bacterium]
MRRIKSVKRLLILTPAAVFILTVICLGSGGKANPGLTAVFSRAPKAARKQQNPYQGQHEATLAGKKLFARYCVHCHGSGAKGYTRGPCLRSPEIRDEPPGVLYWFLKNGKPREGMPSWSGLPGQQRWQLVTYLKNLH